MSEGGVWLWNPETLREQLREAVARERAEQGDDIHAGPFDAAPLALAAAVTADFILTPPNSERTAWWLLDHLDDAGVDLGRFDRQIVAEIADVLGPDATQAVAGWVARAWTGGPRQASGPTPPGPAVPLGCRRIT